MEPVRSQRRSYRRRPRRKGRGKAALVRPLLPGHPERTAGGRSCRFRLLLAGVILFLGLAAGRFSLSFLSAAAGPAGHSIRSWVSRQTADLVREFWYPAAGQRAEGKQRTGDADPSYQRYIEQQRQEEEYRRLKKVLEENSLLFRYAASEETVESAEDDSISGVPLRTALGTVAGEELFGEQAGSAAGGGVHYLAEQLADYDFLMKHFYTVHPTAAASRELMRAADFLEMDLSLEKGDLVEAEDPQILIYHTHSQEEYADYHQGNSRATVITVGDYLTELLEKKGYRVIHDTSVYDLKNGTLDRSKAYNYALEGVTGILQKYPSIQVVLDVHRDGVAETTHLVSEVNGKQTASIMFFNGTSETPDGPIEYLPNPYRSENLAFSFQMKLCAEALYPGFTRNIYLKGLRYNQHLRPRSALIEVGAQTNTCEEALNAMEPLSELLDLVLGGGGENSAD